MDGIPYPDARKGHVEGNHKDDRRKHVDDQDGERHRRLSAKTKPGHGVAAQGGHRYRKDHRSDGHVEAIRDESREAVFKEELIVTAEIDLTDIQSEFGGV